MENASKPSHMEDKQLRRNTMAYYQDRSTVNDVGMLNSVFNVAMVVALLGFTIWTLIVG
jgi:hypothetical protein